MRAQILAGLIAIAAMGPAHADGEINTLLTKDDKARLAGFAAVKAEALAQARRNGAAADIKLLDAALAGSPQSLSGAYDPAGAWNCRTLKLGGLLPLTVYPRFKCRISDDGAGWVLEKLTGSQRTKGRFYTIGDTSLTYVGAGFVAGEKPRTYGDDPRKNQVAIAESLGPDRLLLQFPSPQYESNFDLLALER